LGRERLWSALIHGGSEDTDDENSLRLLEHALRGSGS
jgi:hypothetical protein